jgi:type I restriction enzyme S subunit
MSEFVLPLPQIEEQRLISCYLDKKTEQIDKLIDKIQKKIELLKEQRTSLINQCVTKGLNPSVDMKDSGVEWIGEIPKQWKISKVQYISNRVGDGLHSTPLYVDHSEFRFINGNNLLSGYIQYFEMTKFVSEEEYKKHFIQLNDSSLLLSINGTIGNVSFYRGEKVILGKSACYINFQKNVNVNFIFWLFNSDLIQRYFSSKLTGTTIYNLSLDSVRKTPILLVPEEEQSRIVKHLETQDLRINKMIIKEKKRIKLFKEYRKSLISYAVTGKVRVTEEMI